MVDRDRAQVYAAELAAFDGTDLEEVIGFERVAERIASVVAGPWWPGDEVVVVAARRDAQSSVTRCHVDESSITEVRIAAPQATVATAAHELAHALVGAQHGHDARFRRAHVDVVLAMTNPDRLHARGDLHAEQLRRAYDAAGLDLAHRTWPTPPDVGGVIAL
jgi:hypothetical protein